MSTRTGHVLKVDTPTWECYSTNIICYNCSGNHKARSKECPVRRLKEVVSLHVKEVGRSRAMQLLTYQEEEAKETEMNHQYLEFAVEKFVKRNAVSGRKTFEK